MSLKRIILGVLVACLIWGAAQAALLPPQVTVLINGTELQPIDGHMAFVENGVTVVPLRAYMEQTGATVLWDEAAKTATISYGCSDLVLVEGSYQAWFRGAPLVLPLPARVIGGRLYGPLRSISEPFGFTVGWDAGSRTVAVTTVPPTSCWIWPLAGGIVTQEFGRYHAGIDIADAQGTQVWAARPGLVTESGWDGGYGYAVLIDHGDGFLTRYAHASVLQVAAGQWVGQGQAVLLMGATGNATGPHLHFEVIDHGVPVNPRYYLPER